jgi:hypothetical protein
MAQPFDCLCGTPTCRGRIAGARDMTLAQLDGLWLNGHIRALLEERENGQKKKQTNGTNGINGTNGANGHAHPKTDETAVALRDALAHAEKAVAAARRALVAYDPYFDAHGAPAGAQRRGPTSRELSGEMGGDTTVRV